jgi:hypothetical protein
MSKNKGKIIRKRRGAKYFISAILVFGIVQTLFPQGWEKITTYDEWGDVDGYQYTQTVKNAVSHGKEDVQVDVTFYWSKQNGENTLGICSESNGVLVMHPAYSFLDEAINLSLRNNGVTKTFTGFTNSKTSKYNKVYIYVSDSQLVNMLRGSGQWDVLVKGDGWYMRTIITGNLPKQ